MMEIRNPCQDYQDRGVQIVPCCPSRLMSYQHVPWRCQKKMAAGPKKLQLKTDGRVANYQTAKLANCFCPTAKAPSSEEMVLVLLWYFHDSHTGGTEVFAGPLVTTAGGVLHNYCPVLSCPVLLFTGFLVANVPFFTRIKKLKIRHQQ